jgi:RNA polymerase sigma-70 factor (ECF subfamily)
MSSIDASDSELVRRTREGDREAFGVLVTRYLRPALAMAWEYAPSLDDAEDLVQEGFHRALRGLESFDTRQPFRPWLFTIVRNVARNAAARHLRWQSVAIPDELPSDDADPFDDAHRAELRDRIGEGLDMLPPMQRACFRLCDLEGFDGNEVAEMLSVSAATVRTHRHRARAALRKALRGLNDERKA